MLPAARLPTRPPARQPAYTNARAHTQPSKHARTRARSRSSWQRLTNVKPVYLANIAEYLRKVQSWPRAVVVTAHAQPPVRSSERPNSQTHAAPPPHVRVMTRVAPRIKKTSLKKTLSESLPVTDLNFPPVQLNWQVRRPLGCARSPRSLATQNPLS